MPTVLIYWRLKRNACQETDNYNRSGNRVLFLSVHSYTFVSSILFSFSLSLSLSRFISFFFSANRRDKLASILSALVYHSFVIYKSNELSFFITPHYISDVSASHRSHLVSRSILFLLVLTLFSNLTDLVFISVLDYTKTLSRQISNHLTLNFKSIYYTENRLIKSSTI